MRRALAAPVCLLGMACHKAAPSAAPTDGGGLDSGAAAAADAAASGDAEGARACKKVASAALPGFAQGEDLEFGEAVPTSAGALVGLLRSSRGSTFASVARIEGRAVATVVELGATSGDVPPPQPFLRGTEIFAAGYLRPQWTEAGAAAPPRAARFLTVLRVGDVAERLVTLTQVSHESPSFDVIAVTGGSTGALLTWDEDAPDAHRGLIRIAVFSSDLRSVIRTAVVSPETTDAERPGLAARAAGGYWLAWIARKAEPPRDAGPELEGPSEERAYRWVELVALDVDGTPVGSARRLTPAAGHVSGFSMETHSTRLDLYAAQDDEPADGAGGEILHVAVESDGRTSVAPIVASGTGRGVAPAVVWEQSGPQVNDGGDLAYVDFADQTRLIPLDRTGSARAAETVEPDLDDVRLLAVESGGELLVGAPRPDSPANVFRWLACAEPHRQSP